jgi:hypothetical protein
VPYSQPTFAEAVIALSSRLNDPLNVRWLVPECQGYLIEALRTWNAWTAHWRDQGSFVAIMAQPFYDLPTVIPTLRGMTVTNWDLVADLQAALLEPQAPGGTWTGTDQFTLEQLTLAIQRRRDQFLRETGAVLTRTETFYAAAVATGRYALDEHVSIVRRAAWRDATTQILYPLLVTDEWAGTHYQPTWPLSAQPPQAYSVSVVPPLTLQLIPSGPGAGTLDLVAIETGDTLDPLVESVLGIPDDFAHVVKFGALADLLHGDGLALDPLRAAYCEQRWTQGCEQARSASVVLAARIGELDEEPALAVPCRIGSLSDADRYAPTWQLVPSIPREVLVASQNLIALSPPPGGAGGPDAIFLDVVRNAPVPTADDDILQIGQDVYDSILDIAQHLAVFKEGPGQLELAMALIDRAARAAGITLRLQQASQPARAPLVGQTQQDRRAVAEQRQPILQGAEAD